MILVLFPAGRIEVISQFKHLVFALGILQDTHLKEFCDITNGISNVLIEDAVMILLYITIQVEPEVVLKVNA